MQRELNYYPITPAVLATHTQRIFGPYYLRLRPLLQYMHQAPHPHNTARIHLNAIGHIIIALF